MKKLSAWDEFRYKYDWKTIITSICFIAGIVVLFFAIFNRSYFEMRLAGVEKSAETVGVVVNRVEHTTMMQTKIKGNILGVDGIKFYYVYYVNGVQYYGNQTLNNSILITQQLNKLRVAKLPVNVRVKYNKYHPSDSILWFK